LSAEANTYRMYEYYVHTTTFNWGCKSAFFLLISLTSTETCKSFGTHYIKLFYPSFCFFLCSRWRFISLDIIYMSNICASIFFFANLNIDFWLSIILDNRTGIGKVQHKLSQKYVGLWRYFQELFFCTRLRIWLMVCSSDPYVVISHVFRFHSRARNTLLGVRSCHLKTWLLMLFSYMFTRFIC
jgi:hypothetical protein